MNKTKIITAIVTILLVLVTGLVSAHEHNIVETKQLIDSQISCNQLSDEQIESIGDYYMEQMHPGKAHEMMDQMMGGEGSESLRQMHVRMARVLYCGESGDMMSPEMMKTMMGSSGMMEMMPMMNNMMGLGGMNMMGTNMMGGSMGAGSGMIFGIIGMLFWIAVLVALIMLIIWLYKKITGQITDNGSALEILKKRFAQGKISKKQFEEMKKEIE